MNRAVPLKLNSDRSRELNKCRKMYLTVAIYEVICGYG
jgi:hypothetical protein